MYSTTSISTQNYYKYTKYIIYTVIMTDIKIFGSATTTFAKIRNKMYFNSQYHGRITETFPFTFLVGNFVI